MTIRLGLKNVFLFPSQMLSVKREGYLGQDRPLLSTLKKATRQKVGGSKEVGSGAHFSVLALSVQGKCCGRIHVILNPDDTVSALKSSIEQQTSTAFSTLRLAVGFPLSALAGDDTFSILAAGIQENELIRVTTYLYRESKRERERIESNSTVSRSFHL